MGVLVLAEVNGSELDIDATAKTVAAAKLLGEVTVLCASNDSSQAAKEAAKLQGVSKVLCLDAPSFAHGLAEPLTEFIVSLSDDFATRPKSSFPNQSEKSEALAPMSCENLLPEFRTAPPRTATRPRHQAVKRDHNGATTSGECGATHYRSSPNRWR